MPSTNRLQIAFIRPKTQPIANKIVADALIKQFPQAEMDILDVFPALQKDTRFMLRNILQTLSMYGIKILLKKLTLRDSFMRTPHFMRSSQTYIQNTLSQKKYDFSFQMQSIVNASLPGTPHFVYTDHTHLANLYYPSFDQQKLYAQAWINLEHKIYQDATLIFTRSSHVSKSLLEHYKIPPHKVACVFYGANTPGSNNFHANRFKNKNILFVGIDWDRKGGPDLVKAFELVRHSHPDATLTIAGAKPDITIPNMHVQGRLGLDKVGKLYEQASIFCMPTTIEPAGVVFLEAMSYQLPVVATNIGAIPDFLTDGKNGYMVEVHQPAALARALNQLLENPDLCKNMGRSGYELVQSRYNWETVTGSIKNKILEYI